ncbi:hypothetical protein [Pseudorhodoplanes sp.]|uniref:hypothetical protein n=1 Tax=Pseudorhodoplanes sp. TaxID=1934341 RepID=UPI00391CC7CB
MSVRSRALTTTVLTGLAAGACALPGHAADVYTKAPVPALETPQPAVDGVNWKAAGLGGTFADRDLYAFQGSYSLPLGHSWGLQLDGIAGSYDGRFVGAAAAHLFTRDPSRGLLGAFASVTHWDRFGGLNVGHFAGEFELYAGRWTVQAVLGVETGNSGSQTIANVIESFDIRTRFFDKVNLAYYLTDDWKAFVGHRYVGGKNALALGSELAFRINGPVMGSLFVEGRIGEDDFKGVWGGLRFYAGAKDKTLIQRHRQDDPIEWNPETLFGITNSQQNSTLPPKKNKPPCPEFPFCDGPN